MKHRCIVSAADAGSCLQSEQLARLENSFRRWAESASRPEVRLSRRRILLIFLLIRYTGAKLNEALTVDPLRDVDHDRHSLLLRNADDGGEPGAREVPISETLSNEFRAMLSVDTFREFIKNTRRPDPGFVRRKFYERTIECGFSKQMGSPEMIRKSRAVELMQGNMPLPAVQFLLGHSTPNLTSSYVSFSEDELREATKYFVNRESSRKTSARNSFFGKIELLRRGDIQTQVDLTSIEGHRVTTVITNDSAARLGLKEGNLMTAEIKAPWVVLQVSDTEPQCTAENIFKGTIERINRGKLITEYVVRISDGTSLCSVVTTEGSRRLKLTVGNPVWASFNCFSVVLHAD